MCPKISPNSTVPWMIFLDEVNTHGERVLIARGGEGGTESTAYRGQKGQAHSVRFDLKVIADIGLVE